MRAKINWIAIRTAYVVKGWSAEQCSQEFGVDRTTISKRASKEGWTQERHRNTTDATRAVTEDARAIVAEARETHLDFMAWVRDQIKGSEEDLVQITSARSRIEARRQIAAMAKDYVQIEREVMGRKTGEASDTSTVAPKRTLRVEVAKEPPAEEKIA